MKKGIYNIIFGFLGQIITLALGIIIPKLFITNLGSAANGLLSSVGQVLSYLTILEAGLGGASIQALYKPIGVNDQKKISEILSATNRYYKRTGKIYFLCVIGISVIYPFFINEFTYFVTFSVVFLAGIPGALNYYYQGKFRVLLQAEGKSYIISNITTCITIITSVSKILLINMGCNIIHLQIAYCAIALIQIFIYQFYFWKKYGWVNLGANPDFDAISEKGSVLIHQIANLILTNTDIIILTVFTNLKVVSVYTIYNMVFDMINLSVQTVGNSICYVFGHLYFTDRNKFKKLFEVYEVYFFAITFALYTVTYLLILPFLKLYTSGVTDINYIDIYLPILFTLMKLLACSRTPCLNMINVVGMFKETRKSAIIEAIINLTVSIVAVYQFGIYGVVMGTIVALMFRAVDVVYFTNKRIFERKSSKTFLRWFLNAVICLVIIWGEKKFVFVNITNYFMFFKYALMYAIIIGMIYIAFNSIIHFKEFRVVKEAIRNKLRR
ncbi:sugar isomerase [Coprococcus sp. AM25-15LB]|nr:sugar isomerase [Coprococcus sp. AM25-15LB]RJW09820.1 sugar isomerase [Coprococcus sp. AM25-4LB]